MASKTTHGHWKKEVPSKVCKKYGIHLENVWYNCGESVFQKEYHKPNLFQSLEKLEVWKLYGKDLESLFENLLEFICEFFFATLEFVWKYHHGNFEFNGSFMEIFSMVF